MKYFTVGPSQIFPTVPDHLQRAIQEDVMMMSHRGSAFEKLYQSISTGLKKLLAIPEDYHIFFVSSGTEGMERVIQNCVRTKSFHFIEGKFGDRFFEIAQELGKEPLMVEQDGFEGFDFESITIPTDTELIAFTQCDTSTGVQIPMDYIYQVHNDYPEAIIAMDTVSSVPYADIDYSQVDCVFFSVQKGFGLPAGLGVMIVSPRAVERSREISATGGIVGSYHSFPTLTASEQKFQTPETPNVLGMYIFDKVIQDMLHIGIQAIRHDTEQKASMLYQFFEENEKFQPLVENPSLRSQTALVIEVKGGSSKLISHLKKKGFTVGSGYGEHKKQHIRIANFPAHTQKDVKDLIVALVETINS